MLFRSPVIISGDSVSINENTGAGQVIYTATADDSADTSGGVTYSLLGAPASDTGPVESTVSIPELSASTQHVYVSSSTKSADGTQETVVISYNADDSTATGLGLRAHYDSSVLSLSDVSHLLSQDQIDGDATPADDASDMDGNAATDKYIDFAWASLFGQWPGSAPTDLATLTFDIAADATGSTPITFSSTSHAAGFAFDGQSHDIAISADAVDSEEAVAADSFFSIDASTGEVTLLADPDYEAQNEYSFTVVATDAAGHSSEQAVSLQINNLDEVAPVITSGDTADAIDENSGAGQVIYTATADDSADTSEGISFSLAEGSDSALSIDSATGEIGRAHV